MSTLLVDVGNSAIKIGPLLDSIEQTARTVPEWTFAIEEWSNDPWGAEPREWLSASVNPPAYQQLASWIAVHRPQDRMRLVSHLDFRLPVRVDYPERLGVDRLAAAAAAVALKKPQSAAVVIDIGTATTVDAVSRSGEFLGGAILASPALMLRALSANTQALPDLPWGEAPQLPPAIGRHTEGALLSGAFWGQVGAIQELMRRYQADLGQELEVFLCGRGSQSIAPLLAPRGTCYPGLVLAGIATTLETLG